MSRRPPHVVKTVDLPTGKTVEVASPPAGEPNSGVKATKRETENDLAVCDECASQLVEPIDWAPAIPEGWRVALQCPNCWHTKEGVFPQVCVDRLDQSLDEGTSSMVQDLRRLEQATMLEDCERFIGALHADAILPEDFGGSPR